ncbi:hypothetical protein JOB18_042291 [Solea senegalensis]|uniref:Uncharacterized protein n=1 Tax=Solea senegalensis TaxID=28829 RepID=A0AAV6PBR1_SOLSE|nr:hypothetical protein JOB18_042291 [Solea senegalensis]
MAGLVEPHPGDKETIATVMQHHGDNTGGLLNCNPHTQEGSVKPGSLLSQVQGLSTWAADECDTVKTVKSNFL